jgi:hypothetical protein
VIIGFAKLASCSRSQHKREREGTHRLRSGADPVEGEADILKKVCLGFRSNAQSCTQPVPPRLPAGPFRPRLPDVAKPLYTSSLGKVIILVADVSTLTFKAARLRFSSLTSTMIGVSRSMSEG